MDKRTLGRSGIAVSAMGLGCWAIGGPYTNETGAPVGWGQVDDAESIRAIRRGIELGITLFDTSACYGAGHSETILGQALEGRRDQVVIATKFGHRFDAARKCTLGSDVSPANLKASCAASLKRLQTDTIDLLQFHCGEAGIEAVDDLIAGLEALVEAGHIRAYGWSTDDPERAAAFAAGPHCCAVQQHLNILEGSIETLEVAERGNLASLNRGPLAKGVLTGKFADGATIAANDVRRKWEPEKGVLAEAIEIVEELRPVLSADGRSLAQAAIAWLWTCSDVTIPIPGFKTVKQVEDNARALDYGPLADIQMRQIAEHLCGIGWARCRFA